MVAGGRRYAGWACDVRVGVTARMAARVALGRRRPSDADNDGSSLRCHNYNNASAAIITHMTSLPAKQR